MIVKSKDGSDTLISEKFGVKYHSINGAIEESQVIFIDAGLKFMAQRKSDINVFEMGFGTGLNAFMAYQYANEHHVKVDYHCVEAYPVTKTIYTNLNYMDLLSANAKDKTIFTKMHEMPGKMGSQLSPYFSFNKSLTTIEAYLQSNLSSSLNFDVIFFDAFDPGTQPELWSVEIFSQLFDRMSQNGVLMTYCAQGQFKRNLKSIGFEIQPLAGPTGKREITRALKPLD